MIEVFSKNLEIVPTNTAVGLMIALLVLYLIIRKILLALVVFDISISWLRRFVWFPSEGKRVITFVHWLVAVLLLLAFLLVNWALGWVEFIPQ